MQALRRLDCAGSVRIRMTIEEAIAIVRRNDWAREGTGVRANVTNASVVLMAEIERLREAAEIFRDFGNFQHLHRAYDLEQVERARKILKPEDE